VRIALVGYKTNLRRRTGREEQLPEILSAASAELEVTTAKRVSETDRKVAPTSVVRSSR